MELLVVLGILAVVATIVVPTTRHRNRRWDIDQVGLDVVQTLRYGLHLAQETDQPVRFELERTLDYYHLETQEKDQGLWQAIPGPMGEPRAWPPDIKVVDVNGFPDVGTETMRLVFNPNRRWPQGEISLARAGEERTVVLRGRHIDMKPNPFATNEEASETTW